MTSAKKVSSHKPQLQAKESKHLVLRPIGMAANAVGIGTRLHGKEEPETVKRVKELSDELEREISEMLQAVRKFKNEV